ncbi:hypothetical protein [Microbacterium sp. NPDC087665]|uniref:hypothetical protein n=1 Tax=Microbacterium sp. NPDC087665 TaxID=3364194 RepID=UPI003830A87F
MSTGSKHSKSDDLGMRQVIIYGASSVGFLLFGLRMLGEESFWPYVAIPSFLSCVIFAVGSLGEWRRQRRRDQGE